VPFSVVEEDGYRSALDCDVLFSCVDRPRARQILNHIAYAHLIPVIDGGIAIRFRDGRFAGAEWQAQTVAPGRACLECLGVFNSGDVDTERNGLLDDPSYMHGLPADHRLKHSENVYPFSVNLASMEMMQLVGLGAGLPQVDSFGAQRFHFVAGVMESDTSRRCDPGCDINELVASGDNAFLLTGRDHAAEKARARQREATKSIEPPE
jgi:molybdopterin/thiamine biosynthesis adenylyltransferase